MNRKKREQLILDAGIRIFSRHGFSESSVSDIIREAGVARGTFYLYFKSKDELFDALLSRLLEQLNLAISKIQLPLDTPVAMRSVEYRKLSSEFIQTLVKNKILVKMLLTECQNWETPFQEKLHLFYDQTIQHICQKIEQRIQTGFFRNCHSPTVARILVGSVKETIMAWFISDQFEIEPVINELINFVLFGSIQQTALEATDGLQETQSTSRIPLGNFH